MDPFSQQPAPAQKQRVSHPNPGRTMGLVALILSFVGLGLLSLIFGLIALKKSRQAGRGNTLAVVAIVLGIIEIIAAIIVIIFLANYASMYFSTCEEYGSGTHVLTSGVEITCNL